jgi:hypothetical protein
MIVAVAALSVLVSAAQGQPPPPKITMVSVEGCASGLTLKSARPATIEEAELIVSPTYKMTGTKAIKSEIKKLSGWMVRVRAELPNAPGGANPSAKVGNATIELGTNESVARVDRASPGTPELDVQSIESLQKKCPAQ